MNLKYLACGIIITLAIFGYNIFLIQRDKELFESYYNTQSEHCGQIGCTYKKLHASVK